MSNLPFRIDINFKTITKLIPKELGIRKKLHIYTAVDNTNQTYIILFLEQKSRFLQKDVDKIEEIYTIVERHTNVTYNKKLITIKAPLCSKAKAKLETYSWECKNI